MKRPHELLDVVALLEDHPEAGLVAGQVGTIVEQLADAVFEVEFSDEEGANYAEVAVREDQLIALSLTPQTETRHSP